MNRPDGVGGIVRESRGHGHRLPARYWRELHGASSAACPERCRMCQCCPRRSWLPYGHVGLLEVNGMVIQSEHLLRHFMESTHELVAPPAVPQRGPDPVPRHHPASSAVDVPGLALDRPSESLARRVECTAVTPAHTSVPVFRRPLRTKPAALGLSCSSGQDEL